METTLLEIKSQLTQISTTLEELKAENSMLRKEILGIRNASNSDSENSCVGLNNDEDKTLREMVGRIQFDVGKIKEKLQIKRGYKHDAIILGQSGRDENKMEFDSCAEPMEKSKPVRIRSKEEEDQRLLARWNELKLRGPIPPLMDGSTLIGTTLKSIHSSIKLSENVSSSIVLIISNHLPSAIKSEAKECFETRRIRGPSDIKSQTKEVFSFEGDINGCVFLCSFKINGNLSLVVSCATIKNGHILMEAGFAPPDISLELSLSLALTIRKNSMFSSHCFSTGGKWMEDVGASGLITIGNYLAHIEMTSGPRSIVQVEIWNDGVPPVVERMEGIRNGESVGDVTVVDYLRRSSNTIENLTLLPVACIVEIVNGLGASLKNSHIFMRKPERNISPPNEVLPFTREMFCAADELLVNGMFSYEIEDTDLEIVIAFKCQDGGNDNCFCATVGPLETQLDEKELDKLLDPAETWDTLESRKYAQAKEGMKVIVARNVNVTASMTNEKISTLKIALTST